MSSVLPKLYRIRKYREHTARRDLVDAQDQTEELVARAVEGCQVVAVVCRYGSVVDGRRDVAGD